MWIEARGARIHVLQYGQGRDVLLLHGWRCEIGTWQGVIHALESGWRVTALDFPGFGQSAEPPEVWGVPEYKAAVLAVLDALGIAHADIIAHSFGARVAILLAAEDGARVGRMVLTGAAGLRPLRTTAQILRQGLFKTARAVLELLPGRRVARWRERVKERMRTRYASEDFLALSGHMRACFSRIIGLDLENRLAQVAAPTILFWGEADTETPLWMGRLMQKRMQDAALLTYSGAGHFAFAQRPHEFVSVTQHFLGGD